MQRTGLLAAWLWVACSNALAHDPAATVTPARPVVLAADRWCPVTCDARGNLPGYAVELAREALALSGRLLEYRVMPWERAVDAARAGRIDGVIGTVTAETPDFVYPQQAIGSNTNVFFVRAEDTWRYRGLRSLEGVVVGIANEYSFSPGFDQYAARHRADPARLHVLYSTDPVQQGLTLLRAGRIDAFLDDRTVVNWALRHDQGAPALRESGELNKIPLYIAFSPARGDAPATAAALDQGLEALRANGRLAEILSRYGVRDWIGTAP